MLDKLNISELDYKRKNFKVFFYFMFFISSYYCLHEGPNTNGHEKRTPGTGQLNTPMSG